jgi:hypothetical protein
MIIAVTFLISLLITLVFYGLNDCKGPISRFLEDRFGETEKPNPCEAQNDNDIIYNVGDQYAFVS